MSDFPYKESDYQNQERSNDRAKPYDAPVEPLHPGMPEKPKLSWWRRSWRMFVAAVLVICVGLLAFAVGLFVFRRNNPEWIFKQGQLEQSLQRYSQALRQYERIFEDFPKDQYADDALFNKAICQEALLLYREAIKSYRMLLKDYASWDMANPARLALGRLLLSQDSPKLALVELERFLLLNPRGPDAIEARRLSAKALEELGRTRDALLMFDRSYHDPENTESYFDLFEIGRMYVTLQEYERALLIYREVASSKLAPEEWLRRAEKAIYHIRLEQGRSADLPIFSQEEMTELIVQQKKRLEVLGKEIERLEALKVESDTRMQRIKDQASLQKDLLVQLQQENDDREQQLLMQVQESQSAIKHIYLQKERQAFYLRKLQREKSQLSRELDRVREDSQGLTSEKEDLQKILSLSGQKQELLQEAMVEKPKLAAAQGPQPMRGALGAYLPETKSYEQQALEMEQSLRNALPSEVAEHPLTVQARELAEHPLLLVDQKQGEEDSQDVSGIVTSQSDRYVRIARLLKQAGKALEQDDLVSATQNYRGVLNLDAQNYEALVQLGLIYSQLRQLDQAVAMLERAHGVDPNDVQVLSNLGNLYFYRNEVDKGEEVYLKAIALDPKNDLIKEGLATVYHVSGQWRKALNYYQMVLNSNPDRPEIARRAQEVTLLLAE